MRRVNVFTDECQYDDSGPNGYRSGVEHLTKALGGQALAVKVFEIPPGQSVCPYHYRCDSGVYIPQGSGHGLGVGSQGSCRQSAYASAGSSVGLVTDAPYFAATSLTG